jgi:glutathione synthase/RimK-type ligase-like ATP-grasp enzyme
VGAVAGCAAAVSVVLAGRATAVDSLPSFLERRDPAREALRFPDDHLARDPLRALGWSLDEVPWTTPVEWSRYDAVVIRSTWDYARDVEGFVATLASVEAAGVPLWNPTSMVVNNLDKRYLRGLENRGVPTPHTLWVDELDISTVGGLHDALGVDDVVIKPVVGANAEGVARVRRGRDPRPRAAAALAGLRGRAVMVQPYLPSVASDGELSVVYIGGRISHCVRKRPRPGDFRVQEDFGGSVEITRPTAALGAAAEAALAAVDGDPLYARADLIAAEAGYLLMELELVEPSLYLSLQPSAPVRLAEAIDRRCRSSDAAGG